MKCKKLSINILFLKLLILMIVSSFLLSCTSKEEKIKREFIKTIESRLEQLKSENLQKKQETQCQDTHVPISFLGRDSYNAYYFEYQDSYSYDIQKTSSVVTPYIGVVTYKCIYIVRSGHDEEECSKSSWKPITNVIKDEKTFAYQNGAWILEKESLK